MAAIATTVALTAAGLTFTAAPAMADTAPPAGLQDTVTAVPLPTAQIDGVAWTQAIVGNTVYVGGEFTTARPAGAAAGVNTTGRANLMAYMLSTGVMTSWNPGANGAIRSIVPSADGSRIYVAGAFTTIAGTARNRIAAFSTSTGALLPWNPGANALVADVATAGNSVWLVGNFSNVAGGARTRVAAVNATTGALLPFTTAVTGGYGVKAIEVNSAGDKIVVAGSFTAANGSTNPGRGMAALNATTGASMEWKVNSVVRNAGENASINALASDGDSVYGTGYDFGGGAEDGFEDVFRASWTDGTIEWLTDCHGDNYGVSAAGGAVYTVSHDHYCGNIGGFPQTDPKWTFKHALAYDKQYRGNTFGWDPYGYKSYVGQPAGTMLHWFPEWQVGTYTGKSQAGWDVKATEDYTVVGGEFLRINNIAQQGLVRFGKKSVGAPTDVPQLSGSAWTVTPLSLRAGEVRISWQANTDRDSAKLTYELFRQDKGATPIFTGTAESNFWTRPDLKYVDTTVTAGTTYQYRVRATDPDGNVATGAWVSVTATTTPASAYALDVIDDGAEHYWPLGETSGTTGVDWAQSGDLTVNAATRNVAGQNLATPSKATGFAGTSSSFAATRSAEPAKDTVSIEAWFKTTSTEGGKIVGFGNSRTGNSTNYDRHIYLDGAGRVTFGVHPGGVRSVESNTGYNDGQWHHVVGTLGSDGMTLYLDGNRVGSRADTMSGQAYTGFWRIGGDNLGGWPNVGASHYLNGTISDVAVYPAVLTRAQVDSHWTKSGRSSTLPAAPADAYGKSVFDLGPSLYWRLGESSGSIAADSGPDSVPGTYYGDVTKGVAGALQSTGNTAIRTNPNGNEQTGVSSNRQFSNPTVFAVEAWFKTDSTSGGKIVGFGNAQTGTSGGYDRHVYMSGDGRVKFGTWTGATQIIESAPGFNDDKWHHVVAQLSSSGMQLYLDGALTSTSANTAAQDYAGYWRVGGDSGWEGDTYWRGSIDEVAVYPQPLTAQQVEAHHDLGSLGFVNIAPTASFSSVVSGLSVAFDGSVSSDPEGPIASYAWNFGDGQTASGAEQTHVYPHSGTFQVTLTVVDGHGASSAITQPVTVVGPNVVPTASFTSSVTHQRATFDAGASADVDGEIVSYAWAFGDGTTGSGVSPAHTYASPGEYAVSLLVTDDRGGTASSTQNITATAAPGTPADAYGAAVYNLSPTIYWRLDEATGSTARDSGVNGNPGTYYGDVEMGVAGALVAAGNTAVSLRPNGGDQTGVASARRFNNPTTLAVESWFKTDSTAGGKIVSFGVAQTGTSTNHDRNLFMTGEGRVKFGVWTGEMQLVQSDAGLNDNRWHHAVAQLSASGMQLYIDGVLVSTNPNTQAENYSGYWRVGGDTPWEGDTYWRGAVDEVAIYPAPLTAAQVGAHFELGKNGFVNAPPTASFTTVVTDLSAAFDAGASTDLDGPIASYSWDFGDDTSGTGRTTTHDYALPGTYEVTLTVTDGQGMTDSVSHEVEALAPNQAPTAAFSTAVDGLRVTANGAGSADPDGTITSFEWDFGDGTSGTGATVQHTYAAAGSYDIELTVTDNRGATASVTHEVDVVVANQAPVAAFTSSADNLVVAFNGSSSTDPDGSITSYAWQFGDGATGTGQSPSHTYATAGTYTVALTVRDDKGATTTKSADVTVTAAPTSAAVARDDFERTLASGWGTADVGGAWTITGTAARFSVTGGAGVVTLLNSTPQQATLGSVSSSSTRIAATFSVDKIANAQYITLIGRQVGADQYVLRLRVAADGSVILHVMRNAVAVGSGYTVPGLTITPNTAYSMALQVQGTSPTTLSGKVWRAGTTEPATWQIARTDATGALQAPGSVGVFTYVPTSAAAYPVKLSFSGISVSDPAGAAPANEAPVAAFTSSVSGLGVSVNGSASSDPDGTIASYAWAFGDGGTGTGATATHTYASAGTYTVTLTVTDDDGATNAKTAQVTVTAPPAPGVLARDLFERTGANGWGTADTGGAWSIVGTAARFSVAGGTGRLSVASGQAQNANLLAVSSASSRLTAEFSVDKVVDGQYIGLVGRQVGAAQYILRLRPENGGQLRLYVLRDSTAVGASFLVPGLTLAAGEKYTVSFQVSGTSPTALSAKVWKSTDPEPTAWQVTRSDSTAALQSPGSVGVFSWIPTSAAAAGTVVVGFESISVTTP